MQYYNKTPYLSEVAIKLADTSTYGKFKLGAIIARKNKIISLGTNSKKTHPLQRRFSSRPHLDAWQHAEINALTRVGKIDLEGADVYVARRLADGSIGSSRPCRGCQSALHDHGIRRMIYWENGKWVKEKV